jgi:hypothetical protein
MLTLLCRRCWATLRIDRVQLVPSSIAGALFGLGVVGGLAAAGAVALTDAGGAWALVVLMSLAAGRLLPALHVADPPIE